MHDVAGYARRLGVSPRALATQATELLLEHGTSFLYNHSLRVFLFASINGQRRDLRYDKELLYVSAIFHDLGLTPHYSSLQTQDRYDFRKYQSGCLSLYDTEFQAKGLYAADPAIALG